MAASRRGPSDVRPAPVVRRHRPGGGRAGLPRPRCTCGARSRRARGPRGSRRSCTRAPATGSTTRACGRPTGRRWRPRRAWRVLMMFTKNTSTDRAMMNAPIVASWLPRSQPMPRRVACTCGAAGPARPRMCIGKNVRLKPISISQKFTLPMLVVEHAAEDLRPPVVEAAEDREDQTAEQHVVEVRHDVVGVGLLRVGRDDRVRDAREAADGEHRDEAEREQHRRVQPQRPAPHRAEPVEDLHAGRDRDEHRREAERRWWRPGRGRWRTCGAPTRPSRGSRSRCRRRSTTE